MTRPGSAAGPWKDIPPRRIACVPLRGGRATLFLEERASGADPDDRADARCRAAARVLRNSAAGDLPLLLLLDRLSGEIEIVLPGKHIDGSLRLVRAVVPFSGPTPAQRALIDALGATPGEDAAVLAARRRRAFDPDVRSRRLLAALDRLARDLPHGLPDVLPDGLPHGLPRVLPRETLLSEICAAFGRAVRGGGPADEGPVARVLSPFRLSGVESTVEDRSWDPDPELLGSLLSALRATGDRSSRGAFYTPRWVARHLARRVLEGYLDECAEANEGTLAALREAARGDGARDSGKGRKVAARIERALDAFQVCDPAAGAGSLLIALLQEMTLLREGIARWRGETITPAHRAGWRRDAITRSLHGIDADREALTLCAARLSLASGLSPSEAGARLVCADVLEDGVPGGDRPGFPETFDAVVANPPYVRQERIERAAKESLARRFPAVWRPKADLHVFFCARAIALLRPGGHLAVVTNGKFLKAGYGEGLRDHLSRVLTIRSLVDLGALPVFRAAAYPVLLDARRVPPPPGHHFRVIDLSGARGISQAPEEELRATTARRTPEAIEAALARAKPRRLGQARLEARGWNLDRGEASERERRWERLGKPLGEFAAGRMVRGVVTGCNAAFVIDGGTREALLAEDPRTAEILRSWTRGRDVRAWRMAPSGLWVLFMHHGIDLARYPAVRAYLERFRSRLTPRHATGAGEGRKPGRYRWYEIQDRTAYADAFSAPKIVFSKFVTAPRFAWDASGAMASNATGILPGVPPWLVAILQSDLLWGVLRRRLTRLQNGYWQLMNANLLTLPVVEPGPGDRDSLTRIVLRLASGRAAAGEGRMLAAKSEAIVRRVYGVGGSPSPGSHPAGSCRGVDPAAGAP